MEAAAPPSQKGSLDFVVVRVDTLTRGIAGAAMVNHNFPYKDNSSLGCQVEDQPPTFTYPQYEGPLGTTFTDQLSRGYALQGSPWKSGIELTPNPRIV